MATRLLLGAEAQAILRNLPPATKARLRKALHELKATWPRPRKLDVAQLVLSAPQPPVFRLRVGDWRVVFRARGRDLEVVRVFHRREGYGWLERI